MRRKRRRSPLAKLAGIGIAAAAVIAAFLIIPNLIDSGSSSQDDSSASSESGGSLAQSGYESGDEQSAVNMPDIETSVSGELVKADGVKLPDEIKQLLLDYTTVKYKYTGELTYNLLSEYFNTDNSYGKLYSGFCNTSLQYLIFARSSRSADFHYEEASFVITVEKVSVKSGVYTVNYTISEKVAFAICDTPAESCGIEVEARISKGSDGSYKFDILAEDTDVNLLIEENVMDYLGYDYEQYYLKDMTPPENFDSESMYSNILKNLKAEAESHILSQEQMLSEYNANPDSFALKTKAKHQYNRDKAVQYSYKWVDGEEVVRNPDYSDYSIYGGNCQNYVSQSIFASGIPMDWNGDEQWKWFDDWSDSSETATGRSGSWSGTEYFYEYCCKNTGFGMVAETDGNIYSAQPGDVIQYVVDGWAHHSVIVSKVVYDDDGNVVDLLINSNTTDRVDCPMSAYGYTDIRVIRIVGYNDK